MLDPITIGVGTLLWMAFKKKSDTQFGQMTPEREEVYRNGIEYTQDPRKLIELAQLFDKFGCKAQAHALRARAKWRSRSPEEKKTHDDIFAKALQSNNVPAILEIAKVFESMTASVKAGQLRERAKSLTQVKESSSAAPAPSKVNSNGMSGHTSENSQDDKLPAGSTAAE